TVSCPRCQRQRSERHHCDSAASHGSVLTRLPGSDLLSTSIEFGWRQSDSALIANCVSSACSTRAEQSGRISQLAQVSIQCPVQGEYTGTVAAVETNAMPWFRFPLPQCAGRLTESNVVTLISDLIRPSNFFVSPPLSLDFRLPVEEEIFWEM